MFRRDRGSSKQVVSIKAAFLLILGTVILVIAIGLALGKYVFWKKVPAVTSADIEFQQLQNQVKQNPNNPDLQVALGSQLLIRKRYNEALSVFEKAYSIAPEDQSARFALGLGYREAGKYEKAIEVLKPLTQQYPFFFLAQYNLALAYQKTGAFDAAIKSYEAALRVKSGAADVYLDLAKTYADMGKYDDARTNILQALRFVPDYQEALDFQKQIESK